MAAIFIVAGLALADKVEKKKERKRAKKALDDARYRELQAETSERLRLARGDVVIEDGVREGGEEEDEEDGDGRGSGVGGEGGAPPSYEEARRAEIKPGEGEATVTDQDGGRRRASVSSRRQSGRMGSGGFMRMG